MGAFGITPVESDTFDDLFSEVTKPIGKTMSVELNKEIDKITKSWDPDEGWATVGLVIWAFHTGALHGYTDVHQSDRLRLRALRVVDALDEDEEWIRRWRHSPAMVRRYLEEARAILEDLRDSHPLMPMALAEMFTKRPRRKR